MKLDGFKNSLKNVTGKVTENKSTLLTYGSVGGVFGVGYTGITGGMKAKEIYDNAEGKVTKEVAIDIAKCFIPFGIATAGTLFCIVTMRKDYVSQIAALAAIRAADTSNDVSKMMVKKDISGSAPEASDNAARSSGSRKRIYDEFNERFIETTIEDLKSAEDDVNEEFIAGSNSYSASEFYQKLTNGYYVPESIDDLKWYREDGIFKIEYGSRLDENMVPYVTFNFNRKPETDLGHSIY